jgi:hypothetical protein
MCGAGHLGLFRPSGVGVSSMFGFGCGVAVLDSSGVAEVSESSECAGESAGASVCGCGVTSLAATSWGASDCGGVA